MFKWLDERWPLWRHRVFGHQWVEHIDPWLSNGPHRWHSRWHARVWYCTLPRCFELKVEVEVDPVLQFPFTSLENR